uniref:Uncharacterized protein n=1 Tax=Oryza meridionalis TaxID=40149 RepID=A0A0E0EXU5_9ORYZ
MAGGNTGNSGGCIPLLHRKGSKAAGGLSRCRLPSSPATTAPAAAVPPSSVRPALPLLLRTSATHEGIRKEKR